jgi:Na+/H+ antiporter NhaD/arsenite permease-like protein
VADVSSRPRSGSRVPAQHVGGAGLIRALGISTPPRRSSSPASGADWNVTFPLLGMMIIVGVLRETGPSSTWRSGRPTGARGRPFPLMVLLILITAVASALLDNVTTVLLVHP